VEAAADARGLKVGLVYRRLNNVLLCRKYSVPNGGELVVNERTDKYQFIVEGDGKYLGPLSIADGLTALLQKQIDRMAKKWSAQDKMFYDEAYGRHHYSDLQVSAQLKRLLNVLERDFPPETHIKQGVDCSTFTKFKQHAAKHASDFHERLAAFVTKNGGTYVQGPTKTEANAQWKVKKKYDGDYGRLGDYERGSATFLSFALMLPFFTDLARQLSPEMQLIRVKNRLICDKPDSSGYRDVLLNIRCGTFVGELQVTLADFWIRKETAHRLWELKKEFS